jgi:hypothetical protein
LCWCWIPQWHVIIMFFFHMSQVHYDGRFIHQQPCS